MSQRGTARANPTLEANLKVLEGRQPLLAARLRETMRPGARFRIEEKETPRGSWWSGFFDRPFFEPRAALDVTPEGKKPVLVLAGIGTPRYLVGILNRIRRRQIVLLMESSLPLMLFILESVDLFGRKAPFERFFLPAGDEALIDEALRAAFGHRGFFLGGLFDVHPHPGQAEQAGEAYREALRSYVGRISYQMMRLGDSAEDTLLGFRQMALAAPSILFRESLAPLKGRFKGYSGVVLSAGPSLDKNLHLLKGMEERLVIVAADTLLAKLAAQGIRPHFVCALERGATTYEKYFRPLYEAREPSLASIVLVAQSVCFPQIAGRWPGRLSVVGKESINLDRQVIGGALGGVVLPSGASVAHMALGLLAYLGVDRAALVGQDLAFGDDGRTHTNQTAWDGTGGVERAQQRLVVPGALGGAVETTKVWKFFIDTFEEMIPKMPFKVWDCTEGGALIGGTEVRPLADYLRGVGRPPENSFSLVGGLGSGRGEEGARAARQALEALEGTFRDSLERISRGRGLLNEIASLGIGDALPGRVSALYDLLQGLTNANAVLAYVGQSYMATLLGDEARFDLREEEDLSLWLRSHEEFFDAQERSASVFLDWLAYMRASTLSADALRDLGIAGPPEEAPIRSALEGFLARAQERRPDLEETVLADFLLSRVDPVAARWEPTLLWALGRHFHGEGRHLEASRLFQAAIEGFEGRSVAVEAAAELLKERAKALMGRDLCWTGHAHEALVSLANAYGYAPDDGEIPLLLSELLRRRREDLEDFLIREKTEANRNFLQSVAEGLSRDREALEGGGEAAREVLRRYLVAILEEKGEPLPEEA
ncbi:motility associated factor glycosyltransferase family protein [Aminithiophilus ramosus]|uniref:Motility associated factor glycosyltransferase family protein n=2 Tax=Synergistales TaxID=649776 RepID=A0A9Q7AA02_9BACT|nr:6-hydroxymethylpterin diphosphokinase MptE-like protein [Aminithiophilus ramosus]QTX31473.1 motility associated factor glycosyltransferase family protein [Aminithiophilus ramosus]QVL35283.1 motility associated factor glycosyltransferase family protein [Synergistota bacterium]